MRMQQDTFAQQGAVRRIDLPEIGIMVPPGISMLKRHREPPTRTGFLR